MASFNLGLIGAGRIGRVHANAIARRIPSAKLCAVADISAEAASFLASECGVATACTAYADILEDKSIDAVIVASATNTHASIIQAAAAAGKHIFCEKPLALDLEQIDAAISATEAAGVKLQVGFNRRFDPSFARVKQAIREGEIGDPHLLHIISRDPAPPPLSYVQVSGGIFLDMMIHDFDMARFLLGCEVTEVYASGAVLIDESIGQTGDIDTALVTLKFENGALGVIENSRQAVYGYDQRVDVLGSRGGIQVGNEYPNATIISTGEHVRRDLPLHFFLERYADSYVNELVAFVEAVWSGSEPPVTGHDGKMPVIMAQAAAISLRENRPVRLCEVAEL